MSFTTDIKNEICLLNFSKTESISELSGFVRNNKIKDIKTLVLNTENPKVARRVYSLIKEIYDIPCEIEQKKGNNFFKRNFYTINVKERTNDLLKDLEYMDENNRRLKTPKEYLVEDESQKRSYLRGSFLASGSINDPKKSRYHLEYLIEDKREAKFISNLLEAFDINSKIIPRDNGYMVYVKEAEKIGDFLRVISANNAVLYYEDIRIYRDHKNMTNRLNNCEQANVDKIINSSEKQIEEIDLIDEKLGINYLDEKLKQVALYRKKYPELSLNELSFVISKETGKEITKSGLNHRLRKIHEISEKLK